MTVTAADTPVAPRRRFLAALATWAMVAASQPGLGRPDGFGHTAFVALAPWALVCARPGRRAFPAEWAAAALGLAGLMLWMGHLLPWLVPLLALVPALWMALSGRLLRLVARRYPLALAAPAAWMGGELVRWYLPAPLSFGWWRLGSFAHDTVWLAGSARVWGVWGITWVLAAFGGWLADLWRLRDLAPDEAPPHPQPLVHLLGLGPLALGIVLVAAVPPPATVPGPRLLLVQPGIEQRLKVFTADPLGDLYAPAMALTLEGLEAAGEEGVDLVCWGEAMFPFPLVEEGTLEAFRRGVRPLDHVAWPRRERDLLDLRLTVQALIESALCGRSEGREVLRGLLAPLAPAPWRERALAGGLLPPGTAFLTGIDSVTTRDDALRRRNVAALWNADGELAGLASKVHLVPAAEDPGPWVDVPLVADAMRRVGGYVPDFVSDGEAGVLEFEGRRGRRHRLGISICYDNVFDDPYSVPLRREEVDLFLVLSNEAWYERSLEMDHMVAFSRLRALAYGRTLVRATNSGISTVIDPAGVELARVVGGDGRAKMARGFLVVRVPVPLRDAAGRAPRTPWARSAHWQPALWVILLVALAFSARRPVTRSRGKGNVDPEGSTVPGGPA